MVRGSGSGVAAGAAVSGRSGRSAGMSPARTSDDLPEPDAPTTARKGSRSRRSDERAHERLAAEEPLGVGLLVLGEAGIGRITGGGRLIGLVERARWREVARQSRDLHLEQLHGLPDVLEMECAQGPQRGQSARPWTRR